MPESLPAHVKGLMAYLHQPNEKANEDLAISYFRKIFGEAFTRQKEARQSDGYVPGCFTLELKGETKNWLSGLFQGLAYKNLDLDFGQIIVAAKDFLAIWAVEDIPKNIREEIAAERGAPHSVGKKFAKKFASQRTHLLTLAIWNGADLITPLFVANPDLVLNRVMDFESTLRKGHKVRQKITLGNFTIHKLFFWYALARTFVQRPYPMWVDADDMWAPSIPTRLERQVFQTAFAIAFAENECVETYFPGNNPVSGVPELFVSNPMTPLNSKSFWSVVLRPYIDDSVSSQVHTLITAVDGVFRIWRTLFKGASELSLSYERPYLIDYRGLTSTAGLVQIKDYAITHNIDALRDGLVIVQERLRIVKDEFFELGSGQEAADYFGDLGSAFLQVSEKTKFDKILCKRLALASLIVEELHDDPNFGRTKLAKLFYLADVHEGLDLETEYYREAAGPLDQRALYNERIGIEALAQKHHLFYPETKGRMVRYRKLSNIEKAADFIREHLGDNTDKVRRISEIFRTLNTDKTEIVATLFACWNDLLLRRCSPTEYEIVSEFLHHWHPKKSRFSRTRLTKALEWMRDRGLTPKGVGSATRTNPVRHKA
jgi:hypothetical protein